MVRGCKEKVWKMLEATRTLFRRYQGGSDYRRWADSRSLSPDWDSRTAQMAKLIPPGTTVLEFGAGRMALKKYLPEGCRYTPSDLVDRGDGTIVCDLNAPDPPAFPTHDVAVFSGVLEYVNDIDYLIKNIGQFFNVIVTSYCDREQVPGRVLRRSQGWVNDYTSGEFEELFARSGFRCDHVEPWLRQKIYRFVRVGTGISLPPAAGVAVGPVEFSAQAGAEPPVVGPEEEEPDEVRNRTGRSPSAGIS
jgi:hypothetical protein